MKLNKKFLSCFMAAAMVMAPMSAYADVSITQQGSGSVTIPDTVIYDVIVPTSDALDFKVDPYGVLDIEGTATLEELIASASGAVVANPTAIINKSTVDIKVDISTWVTTTGTSATLTLADTEAKAQSGEAALYLNIQEYNGATVTPAAGSVISPSDSAIKVYPITGNAVSLSGASAVVTPNAITATSDTSANKFSVVLSDMAYAYEVTSGGVVTLSENAVTVNDDNSFVFRVEGYANPDADIWSDLKDDGAVYLNMKFDISAADGSSSDSNSPALTYVSGNKDTAVVLQLSNATLDRTYFMINDVAAHNWGTYATRITWDVENGKVTVKAGVFTGTGVDKGNGQFRIVVKDTDGNTYEYTYSAN